MRYLIGIVYLEARLSKQKTMLNKIAEGITAAEQEGLISNMQIADNPAIIEQLSRLYQQTISTLTYRIQVSGKPQYLKNSAIADTIRALLLAGIRSAVLWHQLGGRRWHFLILRRKISRDIHWLMQESSKSIY